MKHKDPNKTQTEKARWELHKNSTSYFEKVPEATPPKKNNSCKATYFPSHKLSTLDE